MAPAHIGDLRPVFVGRHGGCQGGTDDRLGDEGRDRAGLGGCERVVQLGGKLVAGRERLAVGVAGPVGIRRGHVPEPPEPALVWATERSPSGQVERPERVAVVAPPPCVHDPALRLAAREMVCPGQLQGGLDRLGPATDGIDRRVVDRQARADLGSVGLERLGGERRSVRIGQAAGLLAEHAGDRRAAMADVDDDRAARRVEVLAAGRIADRRAGCLDRDRQARIERATEDAAGHATRGEWVGSIRPIVAAGPRRRRAATAWPTAREPSGMRRCNRYG